MDRVKELLGLVKAGNVSAFNELYCQYWPAIYKAVRYWTNDHELSQDIAQDIFCKLWKIRGALPDYADKKYLFMAARNRCFDIYEKMKTSTRREQRYLHDKDIVTLPQQRMENNEWQNELSETMNILPPATANIFRLIYSDGFKPRDVADQLGIKLQTVRNAVFDGRKILQAKLKGRRKRL